MSTTPSFTKYQVKQFSSVCVNSNCEDGLPRYRGFGKHTRRNCPKCGQPMRRIKGEPRGTTHHSP